jgi:hypothetical protein
MPNAKKETDDANNLSLDEINANAKHDICAAVDKMTDAFSSVANDSNSQLNIRVIEDMMTNFISETRKISLDAMSDMLSNFDEREIIASKKENLKKEG